jgi:hypothetical protein
MPGVPQPMKKERAALRLLKRVDVLLVLVLVFTLAAVLILGLMNKKKPVASVAEDYKTIQIPLNGFVASVLNGSKFDERSVAINGSLTVNGGLIVAPSVQPNAPASGQIYFDQNTNQLAYYNGTGYIALTSQGASVQSLGGASGAITLGGGLSIVGNQLTASFPQQIAATSTPGVTSVGGLNGDITLGPGLKSAGAGIQNAGVISLSAGTPNLIIANDGDGNLTISNVGGGSGTVTSSGGTTGRYAKFNGVQDIEDALLSESGGTITAGGNLTVTGSVALGTALSVASGGTGTGTLANNAVVIGQGTGPLTGVTSAGAGLCLISTSGAPVFQACPSGSGVATLNGLTGALTIANATGSVNTITINDASTSGKGIASFNATNFTVTSGAVNTAQDITTSSTPTFTGVNTNSINPNGALTIGSAAQSLSLLGAVGSIFAVTGNGHTTTVGFNGTATGDVTYNFDRTATGGTYTICTSAANCVGVGGQVTTAGGTTNRITKFLSGQTVGDSSLSDNGSLVTVNGTANLLVQGGTATLGTLTQAGSLKLADGSGHTVTIMTSALTADRVYTLPDAGGTAALCVDSGNCIGGTGSAPNTADYLVASLNGTLTNERALAGGSNISLTDGGANANMTVATVQNPTFTTSVTTPVLQSSGALTITSAAGQIIAINAGTTIELQDSTNVTGGLDVSAAFTAGTGNAFQVSSAGAITAATGLSSSGTIVFSGLNCTTFANGGALTTDGSGNVTCTDDDGGAGGAISGSGTSGTVALFNGTNSITNSIITQTGTSVTIAGDLTLNTALTVGNGGTGATGFTTHGLLFGNGSAALGVTAAGTGGQVLIADASGVPTFASFTGDVAVSNTGVTAIQANSVALGTDTTGNYVGTLGTLTGLTTSGNTGEGSTPTLSVTYGAIANTAVQGNVTLTCAAGTGNLTGGGNSVTLGTGGGCSNISTVNNPTFSTSVTTPNLTLTGAGSNGSIVVGNLGQGTVYTLPDPGSASTTICIATGNCATAGAAGGDLTGTYPNPTIAKLQGTNLAISGPAGGNILVYNATSSQWVNQAITGDIAISESGVATVQANSVALGTDTTGNYVLGLSAGNGASVSGSAGEGWTPTVSVLYGAAANTAVQGNTSITVTAGTNLSGGGSITLGAGGTVTLDVSNSPTFSGTLVVQGATASVGTAAQQGSVVLSDGSSNTGTVQTAALGQNTTFTLPDPGAGSATICLNTGNCAGSGSGVTTAGGTTNRVSKFTGAQALGDSTISDDGSTVTINGTANFVVQGGTGTIGTLSQAGTLKLSDGSSNTVSIVASALAADRVYTLPDAGGPADICLSSGNCIGGGGGGAPADAAYLVTTLNGSLSNERAFVGGTNIGLTDGGANGNFTVATVNNPTFSTSVTTPVLQSSGALTITSAAGQTVAIDAGTTIELQDSTNVTGSLDISASFTAGTSNAFTISSGGAITAATGLITSGSVRFSGLNCTTFANGGALTTDGSGNLSCTDDDGGAGGAITGSGTSGTVALFSGTNAIGDSIVTQAGTTITIAGDLVLNTALSVANGGTGTGAGFTTHGVLYGNGTAAIGVTAAGSSGQVLVADAGGTPTFVGFTGDVAVSNTGATTIQANSVALGTDTTGNYVATLGTLTGLTTSGNTGEGSTPTLSVTYGAIANTAVQGNVTLTCSAGTGNLSGGGGSITLGSGGSCGNISTVNNPTFSTSVTTPSVIMSGAGSNGTLQVANLGQATTYTLPDPGGSTASICLSTGNCSAVGAAGGDLTGTYPNPTIAKLQGTTVSITTLATGDILQYNGTNWVNQSISGDVTLSSTAVATIQPSSVTSGKIADNTIANADLASGAFGKITGVGTLAGLTVVGTAALNTTGTANTAIGNSTGTFQLTSNGGLNVSTGGALTGVAGVTTSGGYVQSGTTANTLTGATTLSAAGTALTVSNDATIGGTLTVNTITPNGSFTVGTSGQNLTLQGSATTTLKATSGSFTTTLGFATPTANATLNLPALAAGTYTLCTSSGNCGGVGATLQTAYDFSTNPELVLDATRGALTVRDASTPLGANLLEVQSNNGSTTYFSVTAAGSSTTGTSTASGNINSTSGAVQTNSVDRISNGGNLVNIGTVTTSGAINSQTISSTANFTGTVTIQGANALTLGTSSSNTGAIVLRGSGNGNTLTLQGPASPVAGNFTLSIPAITANANVCTDNSICTGYAASTGAGGYIQNQNAGAQATSNFWISGTGRADTSLITPIIQGVTSLTANTAVTNSASTPSGDISILTGNANGTTSASGNITINNGTATSTAGTISIGTANTSAVSLGRTGITTTSNGALAVTQGLSANGGLTVAANQNVAMTAGTGTFIQGFSATTGTAATLNVTDSASSGTTTVVGHAINITGTNNAGGSNAISGISFASVAAATNNSYYGINVGTGLTDILRYNGAQLISGLGKLQNAALDSAGLYTNLTGVGALTSGSLAAGFGTINTNSNITTSTALQGGTGTFTAANGLTLGTSSSNTGGIVFRGSGGAGTLTLAGPTTPNASNFTLSIPAITANANVCTDNSICTGYAASTGAGGYIQNQTGLQSSSNFHISSVGQTDGSFVTPLLQSTTGAALTVTGTTGLTANTALTNTASTNSGDISIATGNANGATSASGSITINNGTANGATAGAINIGTANTSAVNVGRTGITTTNNGALTVTQALSANGGLTVGANQNVAMTSGTGTFTQGFSATTGTASTLNVTDSASSGATTVIGHAINITGTNNAGGTNAISGINFANVAAATNNSYYGVNVGTGLTDILRYNGTQLISGTGLVQNGAIDPTLSYTNIQKVGGLTSGTINTGFGSITTTAAIQGGTGVFTNANSLTLGTASSSIGSILFKGSGGAGTLTLAGPTTPTTFTLSLPAISANATVCTTNSVCAGYAASSGSTSYIQNQSAGAQSSSSFWVSGTSRIDGGLTTNNVTSSSGSLILQASTNVISLGGSDSLTANGGFSIFTGSNSSLSVAANGTGTLSLGDNGTAGRVINIAATGSQATTSTTNIGTSTGAAQTINIGSTNGTGTTTIAAGSGGITLNGAVNASSTFTGAGLTDCDAQNSKLLWDTTTKLFSCGTDRSSVSIRKTSDQSRASSTAMFADSQLTISGVVTGDVYIVQIVINATMAAAGGLAYTVAAPASSTCSISSIGGDSTGGAGELVNAACGTVGTYNGGGTTSTEHISATVVAGANGSITFQFGQATSNATNTTIKAGSSLVAFKLNGADLAEAYQTKDRTIGPGDIVSADGSLAAGVKKTQGAYDSKAIGIVSTTPGMVLGDPTMTSTGTPVLLALSGRVPVKVSTENGPIEAGDYLTPSSTPGVAMKATQPGQMVGKALEGFTSSDPNAQGVVMTFANLTWANPNNHVQGGTTLEQLQGYDGSFASVNISGNATVGGTLTVTGLVSVGSLLVNGHVITAGAAPTVEAQAAAGAGADVTISGNDTAGVITIVAGSDPGADNLAKIIFNKVYGKAPEVVLTPVGKGSAKLQAYIDGTTTSTFMIGAAGDVPVAGKTYTFNYHTLQ